MLERVLSAWGWMHVNRRRWGPALALLGALVVGREVMGATPQEIDVELPLGAEHAAFTRVDVAYLESDALVHHVSLRYPDGAPAAIRHRVELSPGRYVVAVDLTRDDGAHEARAGRLDAPAEGRVRVHLAHDATRPQHTGAAAP